MDGLEALIKDLEEAKEEIQAALPKLLEDMADIAKESIKSETPVKTGKLRSSIQATINKDKAVIDSTVDYADDVEFGHMQSKRFVPVLGVTVDDKYIKGAHMFENGMLKAESKLNREVDGFMSNLPIFK